MELKAVILRLQTKVRRYRRDLKLFSYKFKDATAEMKRQIAVHKAREMAEKAEKKAIKANKKAEQKQAQEDAPTRSKKGYARIDPVDLAHQLDEMDPATREEFYNKLALQINEWAHNDFILDQNNGPPGTTLTARLLRLPAASQEIVWDKLDDLARTAVEHMMLLTGWDNDRTRESIFEEMP